ncbi:hypothetical protein BaRGS_00022361 [Batillaria attramentaria]|uniref:Uncharacterized protein n=1 Tax=Batillaria attramentaria TaxID=370345 RepID=A0ABD0KHC9_9CAEN
MPSVSNHFCRTILDRQNFQRFPYSSAETGAYQSIQSELVTRLTDGGTESQTVWPQVTRQKEVARRPSEVCGYPCPRHSHDEEQAV